jgi:hypothetical protein
MAGADSGHCLVSSAEHVFSPIFYGEGPNGANSSYLRYLNAVSR